MNRGVSWLLFSSIVLAQEPAKTPVDAAIQAYWEARNHPWFEEAGTRREEARRLVASLPAQAPRFGHLVQGVAQLYQNAGMTAKARAVVEDALSRSESPGASNSSRITLLNQLANSWEQDQNLLKQLLYLEQVAAALEATPDTDPRADEPKMMFQMGRMVHFSGLPDRNYVYQRLVELYQQLGRPEAASAVLDKIRALAKDNTEVLASIFQQRGQTDEAIAAYRQAAAQATANPSSESWQLIRPVLLLANLYQGEERYAEAAATLQQAIAGVSASSRPDARANTNSLRQNLANVFHQAGQNGAADQVYQQLLGESRNSVDDVPILMNYSNYLNGTKRSVQSQELLNDYLAAHANLEPGQEGNLLNALANAAQASGDSKRAEEYQRAVAEKHRSNTLPAPPQITIGKDLQAAGEAANAGKLDEAFNLAISAMDRAAQAVDRDQIAWQIPNIATQLAPKSPEKAEQLYQRLLGLVESWSSDMIQPQLQVLQSYPHFLMQQKARFDEVPAAIELYKNAVLSAHGANTGAMEEVLRLTINFEGVRGTQVRAVPAVRDLLALQESLSGTTSEPYLRAVETAAQTYESAGEPARALPLRRQSVAIADLALPANDGRRAVIRINAASAFAGQGQIDEAERLANEAVVILERLRPPQAKQYACHLQQIRQMIEQWKSRARAPE